MRNENHGWRGRQGKRFPGLQDRDVADGTAADKRDERPLRPRLAAEEEVTPRPEAEVLAPRLRDARRDEERGNSAKAPEPHPAPIDFSLRRGYTLRDILGGGVMRAVQQR